MQRFQVAAFVLAASLALVIASCSSESANPVSPTSVDAPGLAAVGAGNCAPGGATKDESAPFTITSSGTITSVFIKTGNPVGCIGPITTNGPVAFPGGDPTCYFVSGLGTSTVTVTGGGTGRDCKDISHIEAVLGPPPTPTPTPLRV